MRTSVSERILYSVPRDSKWIMGLVAERRRNVLKRRNARVHLTLNA
jgi:hypothetical protein